MADKWVKSKENVGVKEDKDTPFSKKKLSAKAISKNRENPTEGKRTEYEKGRKKLKKGSMLEKIVKGYAKGAGSDCR